MLGGVRRRLSGPTGIAIVAGLAALALLVVVRGLDPDLVQAARLAVFDAYQRAAPRPYQPVPVRVVAIDNESLARVGQWPWPRTELAKLITNLNQAGAAIVGLDIVFSEPDRTSPRLVFEKLAGRERIAEAAGGLDLMADYDQILGQAIANARVVTGFVATTGANANRPDRKAGIAQIGPDPRPQLKRFNGAVVNLPDIVAGALGNGGLSVTDLSDDEIVRRVNLLHTIEGEIYPSLPLDMIRAVQGGKTIQIKTARDANLGITAIRVGKVEVPTEGDAGVRMHYTDVVPDRMVPAWQLLSDDIDESVQQKIAGHMILVGATADAMGDLRATPLDALTPGVLIHAQTLEQILLDWRLNRPKWTLGAEVIGTGVFGLILTLLLAWLRPLWTGLIGLGCVGAIQAGGWFAYTEKLVLVDPVFPTLAVLVVYLIGSFVRYLFTEREKRFVRAAFSSYVSPNLVDHFIEHPEDLQLGGERRVCSFVMTDLAGFTTMVENADPASLVFLLNGYLDEMTRIAFAHDGTLDRIVGDAVAVMFSAPVVQPDHAERAVACALEMDRFSETYRKKMTDEGFPLGITRIGVHTGPVIIGNVGGATHSDYRALGDAINTAARLESVNKQLGTRICVSGATASLCPNFVGRPIGDLVLKGKSQGVDTFDPLAPVNPELNGAYMKAFDLMAREDPAACEAFAALAKATPDDPLAAFHLKRLQNGQSGARIVFDEK